MNIKITHNWLKEYLDTDTIPQELQKYLSLCGPSVESVTKVGDSTKGGLTDYVYDIEVTSNRIDMASVFGIAQEAVAILPQFNKKAKLLLNPLSKFVFPVILATPPSSRGRPESLSIKIMESSLCTRFTAIILDNIKIALSPDFIRKRLQLCGIKSINNVIDISNYLMLSLGQPVHVFDYDLIGKATMIVRETKKGEKIITLDKKEVTLPGGDIVIEDGDGKLIDLCGIMGGLNSAVNQNTKRVLLFVQTYNPQKIRRTSMLTGQRTVAATYFEKGLDEERVESTTVYGVELLEKYAGAKIASQIYDIYPNPYKLRKISVSLSDIQRIIGVPISQSKITNILSNLGFNNLYDHGRAGWVNVQIPSYRSKDVSIKEDLIEEVTRIYGYHNLPNNIQPTVFVKQPKDMDLLFELQSKIKYFLKHLGLHEVMNYSMISEKMIKNSDLKIEDHLKLKNTISEEIKFMRSYILPSLYMNIKHNEGKSDELKFFEIAKTYKKKQGDLPNESYKLGIVMNTGYEDLKGIVDAILSELNITDYETKKSEYTFLTKNLQAEIFIPPPVIPADTSVIPAQAGYSPFREIQSSSLVKFGQMSSQHQANYEIKKPVFVAVFDFKTLIKNYKPIAQYKPINHFAVIKLDQTFENNSYEEIKNQAFKSKLLQKLEVVSVYKNKLTLRFYFSANDRNITENEAKLALTKIVNMLL